MNGQATSIAQQMIKAYQREIAGLNAGLYAANDKISTLTFDLEHANNMRKTMQSSQVLIRERYHSQLEDARVEFAELNASLKEAMGQINTANNRLTETQAELAKTKERVADGNKDVAAARHWLLRTCKVCCKTCECRCGAQQHASGAYEGARKSAPRKRQT
ncbi:hypothetical protein HDU78_007884 [Chytriomyces hyalinus]|nr:hypothetical protein HDU78_007884 [Chytriomyces hyalinus]